MASILAACSFPQPIFLHNPPSPNVTSPHSPTQPPPPSHSHGYFERSQTRPPEPHTVTPAPSHRVLRPARIRAPLADSESLSCGRLPEPLRPLARSHSRPPSGAGALRSTGSLTRDCAPAVSPSESESESLARCRD